MDAQRITQAAALLVEARRTGNLLDEFPPALRPGGLDDAHAIQEATVSALGDSVAGWKVGSPLDGRIVHGSILQSRVIESGGSISSRRVPLLGVEAEVAFRFDRDLRRSEAPYGYDEVAAAVTAFPAIEIVDSRFRDYRGAQMLDKIADCVSNGAFVRGAPQKRWREFDLSKLEARVEIDGAVIVRQVGGHPTKDPLLPAVDLVNDLRRSLGVRAGQFMTTGTFTGLNFAKPGQRVTVTFEGFGSAQVHLLG